MENDFESSTETHGHNNASDVERMLQADRERLLKRVRIPGWLAPSFGLLAAAFVATPAFPGEDAGNVVLVVTIVASILLVSGFYRATGMKISRIGAREYALLGAGLIGELVLLSVAFGLAAGELQWWIIAPAGVAFALATWVTGAVVKSMRARLHHVR